MVGGMATSTAAPSLDTLSQICSLLGYDPAAVVSVAMDRTQIVVTYKVSTGPGTFTVATDGYLLS